jgi:succinate dehydrogenase/fumarate reductase flavoprotein subunit
MEESYDLVVVGGGLSGVTAAIAAAQLPGGRILEGKSNGTGDQWSQVGHHLRGAPLQ